MVTRLERLANKHRSLHAGAAAFIASNNYQPLDAISLIPTIKELHGESLSADYDIRYKCQHRPFFTARMIRELVDLLVKAHLDVLQSEVGLRTISTLMNSAEKAMGRHPRENKERSRSAARRDVVRTAVCSAVIEAADATLNALLADRISVRRRGRQSSSHG